MFLPTERGKWQRAKALTFASSDTIDLPVSGICSYLRLHLYATNYSAIQNAALQRISDHISKIEIQVDGSNPVKSFSMEEARALNFYDMKEPNFCSDDLYGNKTQRSVVDILFGRFPGDPKYAIDFSRWTDVNLVITNDATTSNFQAGTLKMDMELGLLEGLSKAPDKFIATKAFKQQTAAAAGNYTEEDLPPKEKLRRILFQAKPTISSSTGLATADPVADAYTFEFGSDNFTRKWFDCRTKDIMRYNRGIYGSVRAIGTYGLNASVAMDLQVAYVENANSAWTNDGTPAAGDYVELQDSRDRFQAPAGVATMTHAQIEARGIGYLHTWMIPFDLQGGEENWFDPSVQGAARFRWYNNAVSHSLRTTYEVAVPQGQVTG
jgi:hypothetical protein